MNDIIVQSQYLEFTQYNVLKENVQKQILSQGE